MGRWSQARRRSSPAKWGGSGIVFLAAPVPELDWSSGTDGDEIMVQRLTSFPSGSEKMRVRAYLFPLMNLVGTFDWDYLGETGTGILGDPPSTVNVYCWYLHWDGDSWVEASTMGGPIMLEF